MAYDNRHSVNLRLNDEMWSALEAIRDENGLETHAQCIRFLIRGYKKDKED